MTTFLSVEDMVVRYASSKNVFIRAVDGVNLSIAKGETLSLVGESGCGKSSLGKAIVGLAPVHAGVIRLRGEEVTWGSKETNPKLRRSVQMVFQDPYASLNPRMSVGQTITEALQVHQVVSPDKKAGRVSELLDRVGLPDRFLNYFPHQLSGGQRQRVGIARALAVEPELIICDEAVSALDVSVQAQILNLLEKLKQDLGLTLLFISHDVGVVRHVSDKVAVMYLGQIQELADSETLFTGELPDPANPPKGCRFASRCQFAVQEGCTTEQTLRNVCPNHIVRCWKTSQNSN